MIKTRLREIAEKLCNVYFKCEYAKKCEHFKDDSITCTEEPDKRYCGEFNAFTKRDNI